MTLTEELHSDPLQVGYANMDADAILQSLTAATRSRVTARMVNARTILAECDNGAQILDKLEAISVTVSAVKWAMFFLKQSEGLDAGNSATVAMITQLEQANALTQAEADSLRALSISPCTRLEELALSAPILAEVIEALQ